MAIEKTVFSASTQDTSITEVSEWLSENASEYFNTVEVSDNTVNCYVGEKLALKLFGMTTHGDYVNRYPMGIIYAGTASRRLYFRQDYITTANNCIFRYAYKTSHGIYLVPKDAVGAYAMIGIFIGKTSDNTVIIAMCGNNGIDSSAPQTVISDPENAASLTLAAATGSNATGYLNMQFADAQLTAFCNVCTNTGRYAEGLYYMPFSEISGVVTTITDGKKKYVTNGVFALEE